MVGPVDGESVGVEEGVLLSEAGGDSEGVKDGDVDGEVLGPVDGEPVGVAEGVLLGGADGDFEGLVDGDFDGEALGTVDVDGEPVRTAERECCSVRPVEISMTKH